MQKFSTLSDAIALAEFAHRNQFDMAGLTYIEHPKRVLATVQAAAVLHDVLEDTPFTADMLQKLGFSEAIVRLVVLLTRTAESPESYYAKIAENPDARLIKLADIQDNLQEWRLSYLAPETQVRLREKYHKASEALHGTGYRLSK